MGGRRIDMKIKRCNNSNCERHDYRENNFCGSFCKIEQCSKHIPIVLLSYDEYEKIMDKVEELKSILEGEY